MKCIVLLWLQMNIVNQKKKYLCIYWIWVKCIDRATYMNILNKRKNTYWICWIWVKCIVRATYMYEYIESEWQDYLAESSLSLSMLGSRPFLRRSPPWLPALKVNLLGNLREFINKWWSFILFPFDNLTVCYLSLIYRSLGRNQFRSIPATHSNGTHTVHRLFSLWATKRFLKFLNFSSNFVQVVAWLMCWLLGTKRGHVLKLPQTYHFQFHSSSSGPLSWNRNWNFHAQELDVTTSIFLHFMKIWQYPMQIRIETEH